MCVGSAGGGHEGHEGQPCADSCRDSEPDELASCGAALLTVPSFVCLVLVGWMDGRRQVGEFHDVAPFSDSAFADAFLIRVAVSLGSWATLWSMTEPSEATVTSQGKAGIPKCWAAPASAIHCTEFKLVYPSEGYGRSLTTYTGAVLSARSEVAWMTAGITVWQVEQSGVTNSAV